MNKAIEENKLKDFYENLINIRNFCVQMEIVIKTKETHPGPLPLQLQFS